MKIFRYNILLAIIVSLLIPGILGIVAYFSPHSIPEKYSPNHKLIGSVDPLEKPKLDLAHFNDHSLQKYWETYLVDQLPLRSTFIRLNNQLYYSFFKKSYSENGTVIVGKDRQLIADGYIYNYCQKKPAGYDNKIFAWANQIKKMSDAFEKQGKTFIYIITPSKAEYMPNKIPSRFHCQNRGIRPYVETMVKLLKNRNVNVIDGPALMEMGKKKYQIPMFVQGGIHWDRLGTTLAANEIIDNINRNKYFHLTPLKFSVNMRQQFVSVDHDLLSLLNLYRPNTHYLAPEIVFNHPHPDMPLKFVFTGGSFCEGLIDILQETQKTNKVNFYSYFEHEFVYKNKTLQVIAKINWPNFYQTLHAADVIVLEENSTGLGATPGALFFAALTNPARKQKWTE